MESLLQEAPLMAATDQRTDARHSNNIGADCNHHHNNNDQTTKKKE
jgi:hypothetical protein